MRNPTTVSDADLYGDMHREPSGEVERVARAIANARIEHARLKTKPSEDFETLEHYLARAAIQALRVEPPYEPDGSDAPIRDSVEPPSDVAREALIDIRNRILCPVGPSPSLDQIAEIAGSALGNEGVSDGWFI
jgi:hypothetical protein